VNLSRGFFVLVICCAAGLSFAAGRVVTTWTPARPISASARITEQVIASDASAAPTLPEHATDLAGYSFVATYRILRSATPEMVRTYCDALIQSPKGPAREAALSVFFRTLIQANPGLTRDIFPKLKKDDRWLPLSAIRQAAAPTGMQAVAEVMLGFDRGEISGCSYDLLRDTLNEWGKSDPLALKEFLDTHRTRDVEGYADTLLLNWAAYDPETAHDWMTREIQRRSSAPRRANEDGEEEFVDSDLRYVIESMSAAWVQGFFANDPERAAEYIVEHADNPAVERALNGLAGDLFLLSPERARELIVRLPAKLQSDSLRNISEKTNLLVKSEATDNTTSPRYVAEWMLKFPPQTYADGIGWVLRAWELSNGPELFSWMTDLPAPIRDEMVRRFPSVSSDNAQEDFDTVLHVPDPILRTQLLEQLAREAGSSEKQLRRVLEKSQLPADEKARLDSLIPESEYQVASAEDDSE
jgi:hypothetical protein